MSVSCMWTNNLRKVLKLLRNLIFRMLPHVSLYSWNNKQTRTRNLILTTLTMEIMLFFAWKLTRLTNLISVNDFTPLRFAFQTCLAHLEILSRYTFCFVYYLLTDTLSNILSNRLVWGIDQEGHNTFCARSEDDASRLLPCFIFF